jgi:hypothetical protein
MAEEFAEQETDHQKQKTIAAIPKKTVNAEKPPRRELLQASPKPEAQIPAHTANK